MEKSWCMTHEASHSNTTFLSVCPRSAYSNLYAHGTPLPCEVHTTMSVSTVRAHPAAFSLAHIHPGKQALVHSD